MPAQSLCGLLSIGTANATRSKTAILQAKILVEEAAPGGKKAPKSRGRGFVEFAEHEHALCALRQLNNNPKPFGGLWCFRLTFYHSQNASVRCVRCASSAISPKPLSVAEVLCLQCSKCWARCKVRELNKSCKPFPPGLLLPLIRLSCCTVSAAHMSGIGRIVWVVVSF